MGWTCDLLRDHWQCVRARGLGGLVVRDGAGGVVGPAPWPRELGVGGHLQCGVCGAGGVVVDDAAQPGPRLGRRCRPAPAARSARQHRDAAQRAQFRLAERNRLPAALGNPALRSGSSGQRRSGALVLDGACHCAHAGVVRFRRRLARSVLAGNPQGTRRVVFCIGRVFPQLRRNPGGRRRARHSARAHQRAWRGHVSISAGDSQGRSAPHVHGLCAHGQRLESRPGVLQHAHQQLHHDCVCAGAAIAADAAAGSSPAAVRLRGRIRLRSSGPAARLRFCHLEAARAFHRTCDRSRYGGRFLRAHPCRHAAGPAPAATTSAPR